MSLFRRRQGTRSEARIVQMEPTEAALRRTGALDVEHRLHLCVDAPDGTRFESHLVVKVPHAKTPLVGDTVPVEIDPEARTVERILFDEMPDLADRARASAAAAQAGDAAGVAAALGFTLRDDPQRG